METERVKNVIKSLTLDEKLSLCCGSLSFVSEAVAKKKIFSADFDAEKYFSREEFFAAGCTFDNELLYNMGKSSAERASVRGKAVNGVINLGVIREPMTDGAQTMLSEDPVAVKRLAESYINGAGRRVFASGILSGESDWENRFYDPRAMHELYAFAFEKLGARLDGVFLPGGALNGCLCSESKSFINFVKTRLPEIAPIIAFGGGIRSAVESADAGAAITFGADKDFRAKIKRAIENGMLQESKIDNALLRLVAFIGNRFEDKKRENPVRVNDYDAEKNLAYKSIVLLKNDSVLPLAGNDDINFCGESEHSEKFGETFGIKAGKDLCTDKINIISAVHDGKSFDKESEKILRGGKIRENCVVVVFAPHPAELGGFSCAGAVIFVPTRLPCTFSALKDIMTGKFNPCGKLPVTWAEKKSDYPSERNAIAKTRGAFCYESVYNGYRYFSSFGAKEEFPFGHGLSYSRFEILKPKVSVSDTEVSVDFTVKNVSDISGETVIFAFFESGEKNVYGVKKRLAGFTRVSLSAGESSHAHIGVDINDFGVFSPQIGKFVPLGGKFIAHIGFSAESTACRADFKLGKSVKDYGVDLPKTVPSYYAADKFAPTGVEIERIMQTNLIVRKPDYDGFTAERLPTEKAVKDAAKRIKKIAGIVVDARDLSRFPQKVTENISEGV